MPKARDFTNRIIPLFVIVMIGWVLVISLLSGSRALAHATSAVWIKPHSASRATS
jgi:hypothetical protein